MRVKSSPVTVDRLPLTPPRDPLPIVERWLAEAIERRTQRNPTAMVLATASKEGRPSARVVLLKELSTTHGYAVFFSHYDSRKGRELAENPDAAAVMYWDAMGRQVRFEGQTVRSPETESDVYFASRPWRSQLNAWTSVQSQPIAAPALLEQRARDKARELGLPDPALRESAPDAAKVARPPFWGGYRLWLEAVELWLEGSDRFHDRLRYQRILTRAGAHDFRGGEWTHQWLQP
jgi:pyridoxamine 5'-phosphate oxidase